MEALNKGQVVALGSKAVHVHLDEGAEIGQRFVVYGLGDDVIDPETRENYGRLELVRGFGHVVAILDPVTLSGEFVDTKIGDLVRACPPTAPMTERKCQWCGQTIHPTRS